VAETSGGLVKSSSQWTPEQYAYLKAEAARLGVSSISAVLRLIVQEQMNAAKVRKENAA
jgi:hypothetical protein